MKGEYFVVLSAFSSTEAGGYVFVALDALADESNFDSHVPVNGSAKIKMC